MGLDGSEESTGLSAQTVIKNDRPFVTPPEAFLAESVLTGIQRLLADAISRIAVVGGRTTAEVARRVSMEGSRAFQSYYQHCSRKYGALKTILYRMEPVRLYDFYVNLTLRKADGTVVTTTEVSKVLQLGQRLIISGAAGSGKSTLLRHFFLNALNARQYLPLLIELRHLNQQPEVGLFDYMRDRLAREGLAMSPDTLEYLLRQGRFLVMLDGFDELALPVRRRVATEVLEMHDRFYHTSWVVTSRPDNFVGWQGFIELTLMPLDDDTVLELVSKLRYDEAVKQDFVTAILSGQLERYRFYLSNPLLVVLMLMTFDQWGVDNTKLHNFYGQVFDTLFFKHDRTKAGYTRVLASRLAVDEFQDVLSGVAMMSYLGDHTYLTEAHVRDLLSRVRDLPGLAIQSFDIDAFLEDAARAVCILLPDGLGYSYAHRSFQEYFAARCVLRVDRQSRRRLLSHIIPRSTADAVVALAWSMDPRKVEDDFLIEFLEDVARRTQFEHASPLPAVEALMRECFKAVHIYSDGRAHFFSSKEDGAWEALRGICYTSGRGRRSDVAERAIRALLATPPAALPPAIHRAGAVEFEFPWHRGFQTGRNAGWHTTCREVWEVESVRSWLLRMCRAALWEFTFDMELLQTMKARRGAGAQGWQDVIFGGRSDRGGHADEEG